MSKGPGHVSNRLGLNYGNKARKVIKSPLPPIHKMQDKTKELERRLEEPYNQNGKIQDKVKDLERRIEEQYDQDGKIQDKTKELERLLEKQHNQNEKMRDEMKDLERSLEEQNDRNEKMQDKMKDLERFLEEQNDRNETIQKTRDQKFQYYNGQIEKLDESVQKLTNWTSQLKDCIAEDIQRQYREREAQNKMQDVQQAMQKILATIMEQQHKHISDMIEFQTQLPDMIRGEISLQQASSLEPLLGKDPDVDAKSTQYEQDDATYTKKTKTRTKARFKREDEDRSDESDRSSREDLQIKMADLLAQIQSLTAHVRYRRDLYAQKIRSDLVSQSLGQQSDQLSQDQGMPSDMTRRRRGKAKRSKVRVFNTLHTRKTLIYGY
ncbi:uncharacterized protein Bfra_005622 [Botrytis fragariae]|uniref:Uncharacterized protein n=1 Tax=Botrytis fragariae TaxID=1964551 RepID=A0A8H6EHE7_9HELO|nr:uncharacterized protein Bfra_005622 [Botrytis fragariae]KAF5872266.1 hypothetical protein Bfra_005622 [Botrytis fragariae]